MSALNAQTDARTPTDRMPPIIPKDTKLGTGLWCDKIILTLDADDVRLAIKHVEIEHDQHKNEHQKTQPDDYSHPLVSM